LKPVLWGECVQLQAGVVEQTEQPQAAVVGKCLRKEAWNMAKCVNLSEVAQQNPLALLLPKNYSCPAGSKQKLSRAAERLTVRGL